MRSFTSDFIDKVLREHRCMIYHVDQFMHVKGLNFHDAIVLLAKRKKIKPEYIEDAEKNE